MDFDLDLISSDFDLRKADETQLLTIINVYKDVIKLAKKGLDVTQAEVKKRLENGEEFENMYLFEKPKKKEFTDTLEFLKSLSDILDKDTIFECTSPSITKLNEKYSALYAEKNGTTKKEGSLKFKALRDEYSDSTGITKTLKINKVDKKEIK